MRKSLNTAITAAALAVVVFAQAPSANAVALLTFDDHIFGGTAAGSLMYGGAGGPLTGSNIDINGVVGSGTPLNDGVRLRCDNCVLTFETGNNITEGPPVWTFGAGGSFNLSGALFRDPALTPNVFGDDVLFLSSATLLSGSFTGVSSVIASNNTLAFSGLGIDNKHESLLAFYGIEPGTSFTFASTEITATDSVVNTGTGGFSGNVDNSDLTNTAREQVRVPEPMTLGMLGIGLLSLGALVRRRRIA